MQIKVCINNELMGPQSCSLIRDNPIKPLSICYQSLIDLIDLTIVV